MPLHPLLCDVTGAPSNKGSIFPTYYGLNCVHPNPYVEALTPNVTVLGDKAFQGVIKVK